MNDVVWLYLGARASTPGPGRGNAAPDAASSGDLFEAGGFVSVSVRSDKASGASAASLAYLSPGGAPVETGVAQVVSAPVQVSFASGEMERAEGGTLVQAANGDLFYAIPADRSDLRALFAGDGADVPEVSTLRIAGRTQETGTDLTALGFPQDFAGTSAEDDPVSIASGDIGILAVGTVEGTANADLIDADYVGDPEGDRIDNLDATGSGLANSNDDVVNAGGGDDTVFAGFGSDTVRGEDGADSLDGGTGADRLFGGFGNDTLDGGTGTDPRDTDLQPVYAEVPAKALPEDITGTNGRADFTVTTSSNEGSNASVFQSGGMNFWHMGNAPSGFPITPDPDPSSEIHTHSYTEGGVLGSPPTSIAGAQLFVARLESTEFITISLDGAVLDLNAALAGGFVSFDDGGGNFAISADGRLTGLGTDPNAPVDVFLTLDINIEHSELELAVATSATNNGAVYQLYVDSNPPPSAFAETANDTLSGDAGDDLLLGRDGDDVLGGGTGRDTLDGGTGDDSLTGGGASDVFLPGTGNDTITDFGLGSGAIDDGNQTNNDFIDLSAFYNQTTYEAAVLNGDIDPAVIRNPLEWMRADFVDGVLNDPAAGWDADNSLTIDNGGLPVDPEALNFDTTNVMCFCRGTRIATARGEIPVEDLCVGDRVITRDHGYQRIRWIGSTTHDAQAEITPIIIRAGVMQNRRDLLLSPNHRLLMMGPMVDFFVGHTEVLVAAKHLVDGERILRAPSGRVEYFHMLFDHHELVLSEGCWTESFHPGCVGWSTLCDETRAEILALFPGLDAKTGKSDMSTARYVVNRKEAVVLLRAMRAHEPVQRDALIC